MTQSPPSYIPADALRAMPLTHAWSDWDPYPLIPANDPEVQDRLGAVSDYGKFAFALGCAEWVVARFGRHLTDARPWLFADACWAYELSDLYALPEELDSSEWEGPIKGPICLALTTVLNTRYGFDENNAEGDAAFADRVARYVMPVEALFVEWRERVLQRLELVASRTFAPAPGQRLPRHVLDLAVILDERSREALCAASLAALDLAENPYVLRIEAGRQ